MLQPPALSLSLSDAPTAIGRQQQQQKIGKRTNKQIWKYDATASSSQSPMHLPQTLSNAPAAIGRQHQQ